MGLKKILINLRLLISPRSLSFFRLEKTKSSFKVLKSEVINIVLLEQGAIAPADILVLKSEDLVVDESVLTGESVSVPKTPDPLTEPATEIFEAKNIVFAGTAVVSGELKGLVIATGKNTVLGEIGHYERFLDVNLSAINNVTTGKIYSSVIKKESFYEKNLLKFSRLILKIVVITIIIVYLANLLIKGTTNLIEYSVFCIALIVGIIPEALPLIAVISLSNGALKLAKEKVIVRRLSAVEDLGNIEILCSDKTGTLTEGKMFLEKVFSSNKNKCIQYALLSSALIEEEIESSLTLFDSAIFNQVNGDVRSILKDFKSLKEIPFTPERLMNSVLVKSEKGNKNVLIVKGAPEKILEISSQFKDGLSMDKIKTQVEEDGKRGRRILAIAYKEIAAETYSEKDEKELKFLGYFAFLDPLKPTAKKAIHNARKLGVEVKIITGDTKEVAGYVAKEIGLIKNPEDVLSGKELNTLSEEEFIAACRKYSVFARISPQLKHRIVKTLSDKYEVGFLGEGINDAPALKSSHVGIVVDSAADISREVADIILTEKDLNVIVNGIFNGRNIFSNINKYIKTTLASNFGNFVSIAIISLMIPFLPTLPIQILLINLLSDFPLIAVSSDSVDAEELRRPKYYQLSKVIWLIVFLGLVSTVFDFLFFGIFRNFGESRLQTLWYIESIITEIVLIFSLRTSRFFIRGKMPNFGFLLVSIITVLVTVILPFTGLGRAIFHFVVPDLKSLFVIFGLIIGYFFVSEIVKLGYFRYWKVKNK